MKTVKLLLAFIIVAGTIILGSYAARLGDLRVDVRAQGKQLRNLRPVVEYVTCANGLTWDEWQELKERWDYHETTFAKVHTRE